MRQGHHDIQSASDNFKAAGPGNLFVSSLRMEDNIQLALGKLVLQVFQGIVYSVQIEQLSFLSQPLFKMMKVRVRYITYPQHQALTEIFLRHQQLELGALLEDFLRFLQADFSGTGQFQAPSRAFKQGTPQLFFQTVNGTGQGRLGYITSICRLGEIQRVGNCNKVLQFQ